MQKEISTLSKKLAKAFNTNTLIPPLPKKFCKNTKNANLLRVASEKLIKSPVIGFKAGATGKAMLKKWKEKDPINLLEMDILKKDKNALKKISVINHKILKKIDFAFEKADKARPPNKKEAFKKVYAN